uniref:Protein RRP5 homolog n=1 Tax=Cacopsylla melanoneura TaxID=428564 RepID=A0A8D9FGK4_9HEMI
MSIMAKNNAKLKSKKKGAASKFSQEQIKEFKVTGKLEGKSKKNKKKIMLKSVDSKKIKHLKSEIKEQTYEKISQKLNIKKRKSVESIDIESSFTNKETNSKRQKKRKQKNGPLAENVVSVTSNSKDDSSTEGVETNESEKKLSSLPQVGFTWGSTLEDLNLLQPNVIDDSDNEEEEIEVRKVKTKLTKAEKAAAAKAEEKKIRQAEDELLENGDPVTPDGFDRMLLAQPDNSELWVKYMAYHLQATEIEKARSVARRALTVINIRNEDDRLNVWTSLLNLEHLYGTKESLTSTLHEAVRSNDETKVYINMMDIYAASGQIRELDSTVKLLLKKAGTNHSSVNIFLQCATRLLKLGQVETARHILQRGLNNLPPAVHVTLITRFALAENKFGDSARAQALLEHTLTSYPNRVDVWSLYVDMLLKSDRLDLARQVIQRAVTQKLPPKKLKPLYMKWLKLEEQYGDAESVANVKQEIEDYVKNTRVKLNNVQLSL